MDPWRRFLPKGYRTRRVSLVGTCERFRDRREAQEGPHAVLEALERYPDKKVKYFNLALLA